MTRRELSRYLSQPIFDLNEGILPEQKSEKSEEKGKEERTDLLHRSFQIPWLWAALPIPTLIERAVFMVVLKLSTLTSMWFQLWITRLKGGESFDLFFFAPIMHDVFPLKTLKSISSCLSSWSGQRAKPKGVNPFIFASRFKQPPYQWTQGKAFEAERAMKGLSISITLLTCIRVVSPVQNGEMIFMLMGAGRSERGNP